MTKEQERTCIPFHFVRRRKSVTTRREGCLKKKKKMREDEEENVEVEMQETSYYVDDASSSSFTSPCLIIILSDLPQFLQGWITVSPDEGMYILTFCSFSSSPFTSSQRISSLSLAPRLTLRLHQLHFYLQVINMADDGAWNGLGKHFDIKGRSGHDPLASCCAEPGRVPGRVPSRIPWQISWRHIPCETKWCKTLNISINIKVSW